MGLYSELIKYNTKSILPMHMPGHKRDERFEMVNPYSIDITEVEGMDDLHDPHGIIKDLMDECREYYETQQTYLLVNGSTSGNLTAIASCCERGTNILVDEVCHRSVAHAVDILGLKSHTLKRDNDTINPEDISEYLASTDNLSLPSAVIITSPTYEGRVSDIKTIADIVHRYDIPLIVDEAHGAHLTLANKAGEYIVKTGRSLRLDWPKPATKQGADLVIESLHKTLPALTQTALLHRCSDRVSDDRIIYYHDVFVTSSPSYVLMSSIDQCMQWQISEGIERFIEYDDALAKFYEDYIAPCDGRDPSKIVLPAGAGEQLGGEELAKRLRDKKIEPELVKNSYVVLMTSPVDSRRLPDLNRRIRELQSHALPLG